MESFDGAEICEIVGLFLLHQLAKLAGKSNIGLYRDDGLAILDSSGPDLERLRKNKAFSISWIKNNIKHQRYIRYKVEKILAIPQT